MSPDSAHMVFVKQRIGGFAREILKLGQEKINQSGLSVIGCRVCFLKMHG